MGSGKHFYARGIQVLTGLVMLSAGSILSTGARANDGGIAFGGSPGLLKNHPSVAMTGEVIKITVKDNQVVVDCQFVFTNHGPACTVRMGFPDEGQGASNPDEEMDEEAAMQSPPKTTFTSFRSEVDGVAVTTKLIRADTPGKYWHTKTVSFPAHGVRRVHDIYTQAIGGGIVVVGDRYGVASQIGYILHTGASWHGPIGRSEIDVTFDCKEVTGALQPVAIQEVSKRRDGRDIRKVALSSGAVVWKGACAPTVKGKTLQFIRTNWTPREQDDIELTYGYRVAKEEAASKPTSAKLSDNSLFR